MPHLPNEIWTEIFVKLCCDDLMEVSYASSHFLALAQPVLYKHIELKDAFDSFQRTNDPANRPETSPYTQFRDTLMSCPSHFGPMVRSLEVEDEHGFIPWEDFGHILVALPNLTSLNLRGSREDVHGTIDLFYSKISPRLREFHCYPMFIGPRILRLLDSHPQIKTWSNYGNEIIPSHFDMSPGLRRVEIFEASFIENPFAFAPVLRNMTGLTHLTLSYGEINPDWIHDQMKREQVLDAFSRCGANIVSLSIDDTPLDYEYPAPFSWILANIIPRMPRLCRFDFRRSVQGLDPCHFSELMNPNTFANISFPLSLDSIVVAAFSFLPVERPVLSEPEKASASASTNTKLIFSLIPSLAAFVFVEGNAIHAFHRTEDGGCQHTRSMPWPSGLPYNISRLRKIFVDV